MISISIVNILLIILWFFVIPFLLGNFIENSYVKKCHVKTYVTLSRSFIFGFIFYLASFQIIAVPSIYWGISCTVLTNLWMCIIIICALFFSCILFYHHIINKKNNYTIITHTKSCHLYRVKAAYLSFIKKNDKEIILVWAAALCLIAFQVCLLVFRQHIDTDDARFLAEALEAWEKDSLLRTHPITGFPLRFPVGEMQKDLLSPYPLLIAVLARITLIHPAILAHSVLPIVLIPLCYSVMYNLGRFFFDDKLKLGVFMLVLAIIVLFSFESVFSIGYTLLTIIWQGRSICMTILIPFVFYLCIQIYTEGFRNRYIYILLLMSLLACADLSGTGIILSICLCGTFILGELIVNKKLKSAIIMGIMLIPNILMFIFYYCFLNVYETYGDRFLK